MPLYCDVALPVPVDHVFTYAIQGGSPVVGGRVLVPFRREQLQGVVVALHDRPSAAEMRPVLRVLDDTPVLSQELLTLGTWIAEYYIAPLGEVLRTMLPLAAEVRREQQYSITESGRARLIQSSQAMLQPDPAEEQDRAVLTYLAENRQVRAATLRTKFSATASVLNQLVAKRWIARESVAAPQVRRMVSVAVLLPEARLPKLNANQQRLLAELASIGGRMQTAEVQRLGFSASTLRTLAHHGLVRMEQVPAEGFFDDPAASADLPGSSVPVEAMLNDTQRETLLQIAAGVHARKFQSFLLHGVTGSGKTAVYIAAMRRALDAGLSSLLLVPEIGLTPAMTSHLRSTFGEEVALLHSALTSTERTEQWRRVHRGQAHVIVGTRSAVFAPIANLALIIVDEEHDSSYKQAEMPRYHARDVAVMRAKSLGATVVLGSATPSLESWSNAVLGKYTLLPMQNRVGRRPLPQVSMIDMRREFAETGKDELVSRALAEEIHATLARGEQAMLLLNRRGYSFVVMCRACGKKLECENCAIALTHHKASSAELESAAHQRLECHYCGFRRTVPKHCPQCESEHLYFFGVGSQQGEERLQQMFPHARIARMDRDTMRHHRDYQRLLQRLHTGEINLLVGTQMIAKGHDIHGVTLVGVLGVDHALSLPDFRSAERVFQLLTQVAGRAGRGELPGRVLVQTYHQDHYAVRFAAEHNYAGFVEQELRYRRLLHYPPAAVLANILIEHSDAAMAAHWSGQLGQWFQQNNVAGVRVLGPAAAPIARIKRIHRFHLIVKAGGRSHLAAAVRRMLAHADSEGIPRRHITIDVDPVQLM